MKCKIDSCQKRAARQGWCHMHHSRWRSNGDPLTTQIGAWDEPASARLTRKSKQMPSGCIEWTGATDKDGYGKFHKKGWPRRAHRAAYIAAHGPIPKGAMVRHSCDNPPCVNPAHLHIGSALDNATDRVHRDRFDKASPRYNRVRLSMEAAREIRAKYRAGVRQRDLAQQYGVGRDQISRVVNHLNWKETA